MWLASASYLCPLSECPLSHNERFRHDVTSLQQQLSSEFMSSESKLSESSWRHITTATNNVLWVIVLWVEIIGSVMMSLWYSSKCPLSKCPLSRYYWNERTQLKMREVLLTQLRWPSSFLHHYCTRITFSHPITRRCGCEKVIRVQ